MRTEQAAIPQTAIGMGAWRVRLAWLLLAIIIILGFAAVVLHQRIDRGDLRDSLGQIYVLACAVTGMLIVVRRPANNIGWLLLGSALFQTSGYTATQYGLYGLLTRPGACSSNPAHPRHPRPHPRPRRGSRPSCSASWRRANSMCCG